jgi:hypothetical protein
MSIFIWKHEESQKAILRALHEHIRLKLFAWLGDLFCQVENAQCIVAGSALLCLVNRELWQPDDLDLWLDPTTSMWCPENKEAYNSRYKETDWIYEYHHSFTVECTGTVKLKSGVHCIPLSSRTTQTYGRQVVNRFDADFLRMFYEGRKLYVLNVPSLVFREGLSYSTSMSRQLKYMSRGFSMKIMRKVGNLLKRGFACVIDAVLLQLLEHTG